MQQSISLLSRHVQEISIARQVSPTRALDQLSSCLSTLPLPPTPKVVTDAIHKLKTGAYPWVPGAVVAEECRPVSISGTIHATHAMGDYGLYALLASWLESLRPPPPPKPTPWAAVFVWAIRRMVEGSEVVRLRELPPSTLVRLGYSLQVHCTVVQLVEGVYYIVAESTGLPGGSPHAILLQSERHYTTFLPLPEPQPTLSHPIPQAPSHKIHLFALLNVSPAADWPSSPLAELLQAVCHRQSQALARAQGSQKRSKAHNTMFPTLSHLSAPAAHHLALCIDVLMNFLCAEQVHFQKLSGDAHLPETARHLQSTVRMKEWRRSHCGQLIESFLIESGATIWFVPPPTAHGRQGLIDHISGIRVRIAETTGMRKKNATLPVHRYLLTFPGEVSARIIKSMCVSLSSPSFLKRQFNWRVSSVRHAHDTVSCALLHVANLHRMCWGLHHAVSRAKLEMHVRRKKKAIAVELKKNCLKTCTPCVLRTASSEVG